jgi:DNA-binding NarL/FixJ family response regulator
MSDVKNGNRNRALIVEDEFLIAPKRPARWPWNHLPDVVLVDVYLGGAREGIETARWLRDVCDASVVLVTAHTDDATLERIREVVPGSPILAKPVYRESLAAAVAEVVH